MNLKRKHNPLFDEDEGGEAVSWNENDENLYQLSGPENDFEKQKLEPLNKQRKQTKLRKKLLCITNLQQYLEQMLLLTRKYREEVETQLLESD